MKFNTLNNGLDSQRWLFTFSSLSEFFFPLTVALIENKIICVEGFNRSCFGTLCNLNLTARNSNNADQKLNASWSWGRALRMNKLKNNLWAGGCVAQAKAFKVPKERQGEPLRWVINQHLIEHWVIAATDEGSNFSQEKTFSIDVSSFDLLIFDPNYKLVDRETSLALADRWITRKNRAVIWIVIRRNKNYDSRQTFGKCTCEPPAEGWKD